MAADRQFLILPGWQGSGPDHWQSHWQACLPGAERLQVADWHQPDPTDWLQALDQQVSQAEKPLVLIAHSLGCINLVRWAAQASPAQLQKLEAALLVAPADVERTGCPSALLPFAPIPQTPLAFPALVLGSLNDPAASAERVAELAGYWQVEHQILGAVGHINVASGHHRWEEGFYWLYRLLKEADTSVRAA
ncbi:RBBP9/YdeN family alpha/beta hydrolase [Marinospirillum alkaliphilum]|uniref:Alpha/beta hydrolase family protein n=1 Tax=Marinospirillum alkaliphilum DSM 21637 TaxID=1122209 RepID=A0A1K1V1Z7_9GAMM|nr:alpha/beta hydrolase [Marinospirillum alkaliphilum]SFX19161.1 hypothetical protein SAMN02745752_00738 [Marinospirillum alkaliphilum DSM 21637]